MNNKFVVGLILFWACMFLLFSLWSQAEGYYAREDRKPDTPLTVITDPFCMVPEGCFGTTGVSKFSPQEWHEAIRDMAQQWNDARSGFRFLMRRATTEDDPCNLSPDTVPIIIVHDEGGEGCAGDDLNLPFAGIAFTTPPHPLPHLYINVHQTDYWYVRGLVLHELGHFIGLYHPFDIGQGHIKAIMNGYQCRRDPIEYCRETYDVLREDDIDGIRYLWGDRILDGFLENPPDGSQQTGVGIISGWACEANNILAKLNGISYKVAYGTERLDTEEVCGDTHNGFSLLWNWNNLEPGEYTVEVIVDGDVLDSADIEAFHLGKEFYEDLSHSRVLHGFPTPEESVTIKWVEALQNFTLVKE